MAQQQRSCFETAKLQGCRQQGPLAVTSADVFSPIDMWIDRMWIGLLFLFLFLSDGAVSIITVREDRDRFVRFLFWLPAVVGRG